MSADSARVNHRDEGFTLIEMTVSIAILVIVMTAATLFFVENMQSTTYLRSKQVATQLADDAMDQARAFDTKAMYTGRDESSSDAQWTDGLGNPAVKPYLDASTEVYDSTATSNTGSACSIAPSVGTPCIPTVASPSSVGGQTYYVSTYIGGCIRSQQPADQTACAPSDPLAVDGTTVIGYFRVIVAVTWPYQTCAPVGCTYVTSELRNATTTDQIFNLNTGSNVNTASNSALTVTSPGNQSTTTGVPVSLQILYQGGTGVVTWQSSSLPTGLLIDAASGVVYGDPSCTGGADCTVVVTLTATDQLGATAATTFTWVLNAVPQITFADQTSVKGTATSVTASIAGGSSPFVWTAIGLPAGLTIKAATGVVSGTPTALGTYAPTLTLNDNSGKTDTLAFNWVIKPPPPPVMTVPVTIPLKVGTAMTSYTIPRTSGDAPFVWTMSPMPAGMILDAIKGIVTGTPTTVSSVSSTITVTDSDGQTDSKVLTWMIGDFLTSFISGQISYCMNAPGTALTDGTAVIASVCSATSPNQWFVEPAADNTIRVTVGAVSKCLAYDSAATNHVVIKPCDAAATSQQWTFVPPSGSSQQIQNGALTTGNCLAMPSNVVSTKLILGSCTAGATRSTWKVGP